MASPERRIVSCPTPDDDRRALADGLTEIRDIHQLRRPLPTGMTGAAATRAFEPGTHDETTWIRVNNRSFASHPDQSGMTPERLHADMAASWFDPHGFRLHERDGNLAGFCWTKRHPSTEDHPSMGEIYVIGVDPDYQGLGLGRGLVLAGLEWLEGVGETVGMLYVDADNTPAVGLYEALGFTRHHTDRVYEAPAGQPTQ